MAKQLSSFLMICTVWLLFFSSSFALSPSSTYSLFMLPAITEDLGMGTQSMSFNHPYITFTHYMNADDYASTSVRIPFHVEPQIPIETSKQTFTFTISATTSDITWARVIYDWSSSSNDLTLQLDTSVLPTTTSTTNGVSTTTPTEPTAPFIFELTGRVGYVYGPTNVVQYEDRILRVMIYLKFNKTTTQRNISQYFTQAGSSSSIQQFVTTASSAVTIPVFTVLSDEVYQFNCGTQSSVLDMSQACIWGPATPTTTAATVADVIWADESSQITVGTGILRISAPLYTNGFLFVPAGTTLVIDPGANKSVTILSLNAQPLFVNNGQIIVKSGILRVIGTSMIGAGNLIVEKGAAVEIDAQNSQITFGLETSGTSGSASNPTFSGSTLLSTKLQFNGNNLHLPVIYSEGTVTFISGSHVFLRSFVFLATSLLQVSSAAKLSLTSPIQNYPKTVFPTYIIGGLFNGNADQTAFQEMNELALLCGGAITTMPNVSLIFGATAKFDGLGRLSMGLQSTLTISISFYDQTSGSSSASTTTTSSAGVYFNGPQTERPNGNTGFLCASCNIKITKGGIVTASGFTVTNPTNKATIYVSQTGYLHFLGKYASNLITASELVNYGDILVLNGATVDFNTAITSFTHIRALDSTSTIYFSSKNGVNKLYRPKGTRYSVNSSNNGNGSSNSLANNPTHLFALYIPGILIIRDGVSVQLLTDAVDSELGANQGALFFVAGLYNAGTLYIDVNANLEIYTYTQSIEPINLDGATANQFSSNTKQIDGLTGTQTIQASPNLILVTPSSTFSQVAYNKYIYNTQYGVIYDTTGQASTTTTDASKTTNTNVNVVYGHVVANSSPNTLSTNTNTGTRFNGLNAQVTMYTKASLSPGTSIPIQEYITSTGVVLDSTYTVKDVAGGATSTSYLKKYENKEYIPSLSKTLIGSITAYESASFDIDIIYNKADNKIYTDQILFGTFAGSPVLNDILMNKKTILDNITINIFTNLKTSAQSITFNTASGANANANSNTMSVTTRTASTLSISDTSNIKYPYKPNGSLTYDEYKQKYDQIRNEKSFIEKYLPIDTANYNSILLGHSDERTHQNSAQDAIGTQQIGQNVNIFAAVTTTGTTATDDTHVTTSAYDSAYQRFVAPIFQAYDFSTDSAATSTTDTTSLVATIKTINIIPISTSASFFENSSLASGNVISEHSYSGQGDDIMFNVSVNAKQVQLIAYAESKSSAIVNKTSLSLFSMVLLVILILV